MIILLNLFLAIIPAILLLIYFYRKDKLKPEPKKTIAKAFLFGLLSIIPALLIVLQYGDLFHLVTLFASVFVKSELGLQWVNIFVTSFITAGLVEELSKLLVVLLFLFKLKEFDEVTDGIIYTIAVSLGFACFENIVYSISDTSTAILRAFTAVPAHAMFSGLMGYYVGLAKFNEKQKTSLIVKGLLIATFFHGIYDFAVFGFDLLGTNYNLFKGDELKLIGSELLVLFVIMLTGYIMLHKKIKKALDLDSAMGSPLTD